MRNFFYFSRILIIFLIQVFVLRDSLFALAPQSFSHIPKQNNQMYRTMLQQEDVLMDIVSEVEEQQENTSSSSESGSASSANSGTGGPIGDPSSERGSIEDIAPSRGLSDVAGAFTRREVIREIVKEYDLERGNIPEETTSFLNYFNRSGPSGLANYITIAGGIAAVIILSFPDPDTDNFMWGGSTGNFFRDAFVLFGPFAIVPIPAWYAWHKRRQPQNSFTPLENKHFDLNKEKTVLYEGNLKFENNLLFVEQDIENVESDIVFEDLVNNILSLLLPLVEAEEVDLNSNYLSSITKLKRESYTIKVVKNLDRLAFINTDEHTIYLNKLVFEQKNVALYVLLHEILRISINTYTTLEEVNLMKEELAIYQRFFNLENLQNSFDHMYNGGILQRTEQLNMVGVLTRFGTEGFDSFVTQYILTAKSA